MNATATQSGETQARTASKPGNWSLQFLGATGTVTGSKYLLRAGDSKVLVDCGLFQGFKQLRLRNWAPLSFKPATLPAVVLSHAYLDHSGYVPLLVRNGFVGKIHCTEATYELCRILLPDSGRLQEEEAEYANRRGFSRHKSALPLYTEEDAKRSLTHFAPVEFDREIELGGLRTHVPIRAEVAVIENFSAHADYAEILDWLKGFEQAPRRTFITHGEPAAADALRHRVEESLGWSCRVPDYLESASLE